jgi:nucleotide-binding universal stress UspA family protein
VTAIKDTVSEDRRIVVGVDGSEGSKAALRWAMAEARLSNATIEAVITWQNPVVYGYSYGWMPAIGEGESVAAIMAKVLDDTIAEVSSVLQRPVTVLPRVVEGHPTQTLLDAAAGADLLVVGSRGHSTFAGILLGSVSQHCVQHAPCPVVVVPQ